jgi:hypothetical protein
LKTLSIFFWFLNRFFQFLPWRKLRLCAALPGSSAAGAYVVQEDGSLRPAQWSQKATPAASPAAPQHDHIDQALIPDLFGDLVGRYKDDLQIIPLRAPRFVKEALAISTPPEATIGSYLSRDGRFMTMAALGLRTSGEPISSSGTTTVQLAVPPRISGP